jgi:hypothetical protein
VRKLIIIGIIIFICATAYATTTLYDCTIYKGNIFGSSIGGGAGAGDSLLTEDGDYILLDQPIPDHILLE